MASLWFDCTRSGDDSTLAGHSETDSTLAGLKFPDLNGLRMCRTVSPSLLQGGNFSRQVPASLAGPLSGPFRLITCNLLSRILVKLSPCPVPLKLRVSDSEWLSRSPMALSFRLRLLSMERSLCQGWLGRAMASHGRCYVMTNRAVWQYCFGAAPAARPSLSMG
jgi:hypothetical protein